MQKNVELFSVQFGSKLFLEVYTTRTPLSFLSPTTHTHVEYQEFLVTLNLITMKPASKPKVKTVKRVTEAGQPRGRSAKKARTEALAVPPYDPPHRFSEDLPLSIEMNLFSEAAIPPDWSTSASARKAAQGTMSLARLMGTIVLEFVDVTEASFVKIFRDKFGQQLHPSEVLPDEDGDYPNDPRSHIHLYQLSFMVGKGWITPKSSSSSACLRDLYALQCPSSSQWGKPFIRVRSSHNYNWQNETIEIRYAVYFGRLIFELISDSAIKNIVENLVDIPGNASQIQELKHRPEIFSRADAELLQLPKYRFSLAGLLKHTESTGYSLSKSDPRGLKVKLYDYQRSSYQWMLDQENESRGLNAHFWQEWKFADNQSLFYFPLGGEFRFDRPPITNGGLLCEEMGLGIEL